MSTSLAISFSSLHIFVVVSSMAVSSAAASSAAPSVALYITDPSASGADTCRHAVELGAAALLRLGRQFGLAYLGSSWRDALDHVFVARDGAIGEVRWR